MARLQSQDAQFYSRLMSSYNQVLTYEVPQLQDLYLSHIPVDELQKRADNIQQTKLEAENKTVSPEDCLLLALLKWFKYEFFRGWAAMAKCDDCGTEGTPVGKGTPTADELRWEAFNIELYQCPNCKKMLRFPRYNHPQKLLETRTGRCGEWANAFTMCCVALGFKTRYVVDWTDHVWTEVFSEAQQRWLHCDPCENVCDRPLMYEAGWNKKLTYVIGFSKTQIMDVTWRYSNKHDEVLKRRKQCRESWLVAVLADFNKRYFDQLSGKERKVAETLYIKELVSFLTVRGEVKDEEKQGRTSGSVEWRRMRGELGGPGTKETRPCYVFKPSAEDLEVGRLRVRYCTATDTYYRCLEDVVSPGKEDLKGWRNGVYSVKSMFRKEEEDWQMTYLAREEGSDLGTVNWVLDFSECAAEPKCVDIRACFSTFENGEVKMVFTEDKEDGLCRLLDGGEEFRTFQLSGFPVLKLTAKLQSKTNHQSNCWQHSQLFRQSLNGREEYPLDIIVTVKRKVAENSGK